MRSTTTIRLLLLIALTLSCSALNCEKDSDCTTAYGSDYCCFQIVANNSTTTDQTKSCIKAAYIPTFYQDARSVATAGYDYKMKCASGQYSYSILDSSSAVMMLQSLGMVVIVGMLIGL